MRFKVSLVNDHGNLHEETVIANNAKEAKHKVLTINPNSKVIEATWVYK